METKFNNLIELQDYFSDENKCRDYLEDFAGAIKLFVRFAMEKIITSLRIVEHINANPVKRNLMPRSELSLKILKYH